MNANVVSFFRLGPWRRWVGSVMAVVYGYANVLAPGVVQASFWGERRQAVQRVRDGVRHLASFRGGVRSPRRRFLTESEERLLGTTWESLGVEGDNPGPDPDVAPLGPRWVGELGQAIGPYGDIREAWFPTGHSTAIRAGPKAPVVIHIQDAHEHEEAQRNIAQLLQLIATHAPSQSSSLLVGLEGSTGPLQIEPYRAFPDQQAMREVADYLLKEAFLSGPEYAAITAPTSSLALKERGVAGATNRSAEPATGGHRERLCGLCTPRPPSAARGGEGGSLCPLLLWGLEDPTLYWQHVSVVEQSLASEQNAQAAHDRLLAAVARLKGERSSGQILTRALAGSYDRSHQLKELDRDLHLLGKLFRHTLTTEEWQAYLSRRSTIHTLASRYRLFLPSPSEGESGAPTPIPRGEGGTTDVLAQLSSFEQFYDLAVQRNHALVTNLLAKMDESGSDPNFIVVPAKAGTQRLDPRLRPSGMTISPRVAVLVAGGFHTPGITHLLRQCQVGYLVITPRITRVPSDHHPLATFRRQPTPIERLFFGDQLSLKRVHLTAEIPEDPVLSLSAGHGLRPGSGQTLDWIIRARLRAERRRQIAHTAYAVALSVVNAVVKQCLASRSRETFPPLVARLPNAVRQWKGFSAQQLLPGDFAVSSAHPGAIRDLPVRLTLDFHDRSTHHRMPLVAWVNPSVASSGQPRVAAAIAGHRIELMLDGPSTSKTLPRVVNHMKRTTYELARRGLLWGGLVLCSLTWPMLIVVLAALPEFPFSAMGALDPDKERMASMSNEALAEAIQTERDDERLNALYTQLINKNKGLMWSYIHRVVRKVLPRSTPWEVIHELQTDLRAEVYYQLVKYLPKFRSQKGKFSTFFLEVVCLAANRFLTYGHPKQFPTPFWVYQEMGKAMPILRSFSEAFPGQALGVQHADWLANKLNERYPKGYHGGPYSVHTAEMLLQNLLGREIHVIKNWHFPPQGRRRWYPQELSVYQKEWRHRLLYALTRVASLRNQVIYCWRKQVEETRYPLKSTPRPDSKRTYQDSEAMLARIGEVWGITQERVRQIVNRTEAKVSKRWALDRVKGIIPPKTWDDPRVRRFEQCASVEQAGRRTFLVEHLKVGPRNTLISPAAMWELSDIPVEFLRYRLAVLSGHDRYLDLGKHWALLTQDLHVAIEELARNYHASDLHGYLETLQAQHQVPLDLFRLTWLVLQRPSQELPVELEQWRQSLNTWPTLAVKLWQELPIRERLFDLMMAEKKKRRSVQGLIQRLDELSALFDFKTSEVVIPYRPEELLTEVLKIFQGLDQWSQELRSAIAHSMAVSLRQQLTDRQLSQMDVARASGVDHSYISSIKNQRLGAVVPSRDVRRRLADALGIPFRTFAPERSEDPSQDEELLLRNAIVQGRQLAGTVLAWAHDAYRTYYTRIEDSRGDPRGGSRLRREVAEGHWFTLDGIQEVIQALVHLSQDQAPQPVLWSRTEERRLALGRLIGHQIGEKLAALREKQGKTCVALAREAGLSVVTLHRREQGVPTTQRSVANLSPIATALKTTVEDLTAHVQDELHEEARLDRRSRTQQEEARIKFARVLTQRGRSLLSLTRGRNTNYQRLADLKTGKRSFRPQHLLDLAAAGFPTEEVWPTEDLIRITYRNPLAADTTSDAHHPTKAPASTVLPEASLSVLASSGLAGVVGVLVVAILITAVVRWGLHQFTRGGTDRVSSRRHVLPSVAMEVLGVLGLWLLRYVLLGGIPGSLEGLPLWAMAKKPTTPGADQSPAATPTEQTTDATELVKPSSTARFKNYSNPAIHLLETGFPRFTLGMVQEINQRTDTFAGTVNGLMINPITNELVVSHLWEQARGEEWPYNQVYPLKSVTATLYERVGASPNENLWFDDRYVPIGGDVLHSDGSPFTEEDLARAGLRKVRQPGGEPIQVRMLATGGRVFALAGPWVVPYVNEGVGIRILRTLDDVRALYHGAVSFETLPEVLGELEGKGSVRLRLAAALEYKGIGMATFNPKGDSSVSLKALAGQTVYIPDGDVQTLLKDIANAGDHMGVGAISNGDSLSNDLALRCENAEMEADTIAYYPLFNESTLPTLEKTPWKQTGYSVRLSYDTNRLSAFTYSWSDGGPSAERALALSYYGKLTGLDDHNQLVTFLLSRFLNSMARNMRAFWVLQKERTWESNVLDNYSPLFALIDTGADSLEDITTEQQREYFFSDWRNYPLSFLEAVVLALTRAPDQPSRNPFEILVTQPTFRQDFLQPLLLDQPLVEEAYREFLAAVRERPRFSYQDTAMDMYRFVELTRKYLMRIPRTPGQGLASPFLAGSSLSVLASSGLAGVMEALVVAILIMAVVRWGLLRWLRGMNHLVIPRSPPRVGAGVAEDFIEPLTETGGWPERHRQLVRTTMGWQDTIPQLFWGSTDPSCPENVLVSPLESRLLRGHQVSLYQQPSL